MSLEIELHPPGKGSQRASLRGRLDTHTYEDLDEALAPLMTRHLHSLVLDLSGLEYISSAGIRSVFKARKALAPHGGKVLLVNPQPQIQKVLDMVKAVPLNEIFSSTAEADAYLDLMQRKVLDAAEDED
jgi:anti-anti-sigma factor